MPDQTAIDHFQELVTLRPNTVVFTFVSENGKDNKTLTYKELDRDAKHIAAKLVKNRLTTGSRVLLVYPPSLDFITALVGCFYARLIPVPVYPPDPSGSNVAAICRIIKDCSASAILTNGRYRSAKRFASLRQILTLLISRRRQDVKWPEIKWICTDKTFFSKKNDFVLSRPSLKDIALIQYTSGSTGNPKGVCITWGNLEHQLSCNAEELDLSDHSRSVLWLPQYHDFGLLNGIMSIIFGNGALWLMSPITFIHHPRIWFDVMHRVKATHTAAPNFAYAYTLRKTTPEQRQNWDLSSIQIIVNSAEPVSPSTVDKFLNAFQVSGLREGAICPTYGLAENSPGITVSGKLRIIVDSDQLEHEGKVTIIETSDNTTNQRSFVGCGKPFADTEIRIVNPDTLVAYQDAVVGEIWAKSPSTAAGYWGNSKLTNEIFRAKIRDDESDRTYLRTGDLGFLLNGELFVTGRIKDMIVIRGRNIHPQDLEDHIRDHPLVRPGGIAAFAVRKRHEGKITEQIGMGVELRETVSQHHIDSLVSHIRRCLLAREQVYCAVVIIGKKGMLPKTTSGKLSRYLVRKKYHQGKFRKEALFINDYCSKTGDEFTTNNKTESNELQNLQDLRLKNVDCCFQRLITHIALDFAQRAKANEKRTTYFYGTVASGNMQILDSLDIPNHNFFKPGRCFPVIVRHTNMKGFEDDAILDGRGLTLRVLTGEMDENQNALNLTTTLLDVITSTGKCFILGNALDFARWFRSKLCEREKMLNEFPEIKDIFRDIVRDPDSYTRLHYYSQVTYYFIDSSGKSCFMRYRVLPRNKQSDTGFINSERLQLPLDYIPRSEVDGRSKNYLQEDFRRCVETSGVDYLLQIQLREESKDKIENERAQNCTQSWPEDKYPFHDIAHIHLNAILPDKLIQNLEFNPCNAPADLQLIPACTATESASINHLRSIIYEISAKLSREQRLPDDILALQNTLPQERTSIKEAIEQAAEACCLLVKNGDISNPVERLSGVIAESALSFYPVILRYLIDTFQRCESKIDKRLWEQDDCCSYEDINAAFESFNQVSKLITISDVEAFSACHMPVCLRVQRASYANASTDSRIFSNRSYLTKWLYGSLLTPPNTFQFKVGKFIYINEMSIIAMCKYADNRPSEGRVILKDFISYWTYSTEKRWLVKFNLETFYHEILVSDTSEGERVIQNFFNEPVTDDELTIKLALGMLGGIFVDAFKKFDPDTRQISSEIPLEDNGTTLASLVVDIQD